MLVEMNQEFISEDKLYRVVGSDVDFKEFTMADKEVKVDAVVAVDPAIPPDQETRLNQSLLLYDKFIAQDKPDPNNAEETAQWKKRKRMLQEMILEEIGKEAYKTALLGAEPKQAEKQKEETKINLPESEAGVMPEQNSNQSQERQNLFKKILSRLPFINKNKKTSKQ
jgi:hypothetical protein